MADYANIKPGVRTSVSVGTHTVGIGEYLIEIGGAAGGKGGDASARATNRPNDGTTGPYVYGGAGGAGGSCRFVYEFAETASFSVNYGNGGSEGRTTYVPDNASGFNWGIAGGSGSDTTLSINGVLVAKCTGGGGGGGGWFNVTALPAYPPEVIRTWTAGDGSQGTPGRIALAPAWHQAGGAYGMFITKLNNVPNTPTTITYGQPFASRPLELSCPPTTDPEGDAITYVWERRIDTGAYITVGTTAEPKHIDTVPSTGTTVQYRVKAVDSKGAESGYATGDPKLIIYNFPPTISGEDLDRGSIYLPFTHQFSVDDPDIRDTITVKILLDGSVLATYENAIRNQNYSIDLAGAWLHLHNGNHKLEIIATDSAGASTKRIISFTRATKGLHLQLANVIQPRSGGVIRTLLSLFQFTRPTDSTLLITVTNNALSATPAWHDITENHARKDIFEFPTTPTEQEAGFSAQIKIQKAAGSPEEIIFTGAMFILNANGKESDKWADNIIHTQTFTGALTGAQTVADVARIIDRDMKKVGLNILGYYDSAAALSSAKPTGKTGDMYSVGSTPFLYIWDENKKSWVNIGVLQAGATGAAGARGEKGDKGDRGLQGLPGAQGLKGEQGEAGPKGDKGDRGEKGEKGDKGIDGAKGEKGDRGDDGHGLTIISRYDTSTDLEIAQPAGTAGDAYFVGISAPFEVYMWDEANSQWENRGVLEGVKGDKGDKGDKGEAGEKGEKGELGEVEPMTSFKIGVPSEGWTKNGDYYSITIEHSYMTPKSQIFPSRSIYQDARIPARIYAYTTIEGAISLSTTIPPNEFVNLMLETQETNSPIYDVVLADPLSSSDQLIDLFEAAIPSEGWIKDGDLYHVDVKALQSLSGRQILPYRSFYQDQRAKSRIYASIISDEKYRLTTAIPPSENFYVMTGTQKTKIEPFDAILADPIIPISGSSSRTQTYTLKADSLKPYFTLGTEWVDQKPLLIRRRNAGVSVWRDKLVISGGMHAELGISAMYGTEVRDILTGDAVQITHNYVSSSYTGSKSSVSAVWGDFVFAQNINSYSTQEFSIINMVDHGVEKISLGHDLVNNSAAITDNGIMYLFGGILTSSPTARNDVLVLDTKSSDPGFANGINMPRSREKHASVYLNNKIYLIGGEQSSKLVKQVDIFDVASQTWSTDPSLEIEASDTSACVYDHTKIVYLNTDTVDGSVRMLDTVTNTITTLPTLPERAYGVGLAAYGHNIYAIGGISYNYNPSAIVRHLKPALTKAAKSKVLLSIEENAVVYGDKECVVDGITIGTIMNPTKVNKRIDFTAQNLYETGDIAITVTPA